MAPYMARLMSRNGVYVSATDFSASAMFTATEEPWIYCTSIAPTRSYGAGALKREFSDSKGRDAALSAIDNPRLFARHLGIELALGVEVGRDVADDYVRSLLDPKFARQACGVDALPPVDTVVWVTHGPVHLRGSAAGDRDPE